MTTRDEKLDAYISEARKYFPGINASNISSLFNPEIHPEPISGKIQLSGRFINETALQNGPLSFIHYTTVQNTMNILNSGNVRLYNCLNLNDPSEIKYLLKKSELTFSDDEIEQYKREHFILSGSMYNSATDEDFNLWRLYGDSGQGIGIVFEIDDKIKNWNNIYIQKVTYGNDDVLNEFFKFHKTFNLEYSLFENKPDFFALLATSIKNDIWSVEKEFRVVVHSEFDQIMLQPENPNLSPLISQTLKHELKDNGKLVSYVEIPLHLNNHSPRKVKSPFKNEEIELLDYVPNLKIKKLILGINSPFKKRSDFLDFEMWIKQSMNYDFDVALSSIKL